MAGVALGFCSCTELPNDIGVRRHRSTARQTRLASPHPIPSSWNDAAPSEGRSKILINLTTQQAFFYRGGVLVGQTNLSSGRKDFETPPGSYHAQRLSAKINLIPYNTVEGLPWSRPSRNRQEIFLRILRHHGAVATLRREKGHDIDAACGQLRLQTKRAENAPASAV